MSENNQTELDEFVALLDRIGVVRSHTFPLPQNRTSVTIVASIDFIFQSGKFVKAVDCNYGNESKRMKAKNDGTAQ